MFSGIAWGIFGVYCLIYLIFLTRIKKPLSFFLMQTAVSLCVLAIINLTAFATGMYVPVNPYTVLGTSVGGVPTIFGFLALRYIIVL